MTIEETRHIGLETMAEHQMMLESADEATPVSQYKIWFA